MNLAFIKPKKCFLFGAGFFDKLYVIPKKIDLIIAVDAGFDHCKKLNIHPDFLIGDFDSIENIPENINKIEYPKEKNETDMMLAINIGLNQGCDIFFVYGGMGGLRFSHTLSNIECAVRLSKLYKTIYIFGEHNNIITVITNRKIKFDKNKKGFISVMSHTDISYGINLIGLKYEAKNLTLTNEFPLGVSNEFIGKQSEISVSNGTIIIIYNEK